VVITVELTVKLVVIMERVATQELVDLHQALEPMGQTEELVEVEVVVLHKQHLTVVLGELTL
jgi:hypothetical protein